MMNLWLGLAALGCTFEENYAYELTYNETTEALADSIEEDLTPLEIDYLLALEWSEQEALNSDPIFRLVVDLFVQVSVDAGEEPAAPECEEWTKVGFSGFSPSASFVQGSAMVPNPPRDGDLIGIRAQATLDSAGESVGLSGAEIGTGALECEEEGELSDPEAFGLAWAGTCDVSDCVEIYELERGENCGEPDSLSFHYRNICEEPVSVLWCIENPDSDWSCGVNTGLDPGEDSSGAFTCHATGEYVVIGLPHDLHADDTCPFYGDPRD